jgi:hypothetical protein
MTRLIDDPDLQRELLALAYLVMWKLVPVGMLVASIWWPR